MIYDDGDVQVSDSSNARGRRRRTKEIRTKSHLQPASPPTPSMPLTIPAARMPPNPFEIELPVEMTRVSGISCCTRARERGTETDQSRRWQFAGAL